MKKRRVVITGMGLVSCFGTDIDDFYKKLLNGRSGVVKIEEFPCDNYPTRIAATIRNFDVGNYIDKKQARRIDPFIRYAMVAGKKAIEMSRLEKFDNTRCGILIGSGMGGMTAFYDGVLTIKDKGFDRLTPFFVPYIITNMAGAMLAIDLGFKGPNYSISTACATSNYSIIAAANEIRNGSADLMLAGGSEAPMSPIGLSGFIAAKALSTRNDDPEKASRPWDRDRDGFVMGEGSGVLVLESLEHALKRKAPILAEYMGGSVTCDAYHITLPREDGSEVKRCIEESLLDAKIEKQRVNYINAHATSTILGDLCEVRAIRSFFGSHTKKIKINSTKSMIGHCLGAAGGIEAIATIKAIETGRLHPTINLDNPEPELGDLDPVANRAISHDVDVAISCSFGFGGHNAVIVLKPYEK